jgi:hypothetical protein
MLINIFCWGVQELREVDVAAQIIINDNSHVFLQLEFFWKSVGKYSTITM